MFLDCVSTEMEFINTRLCHDCFFENLKNVTKEEGFEDGMLFYVLTKTTELELKFQSEDTVDEMLKENSTDVHMEDFIKDILES